MPGQSLRWGIVGTGGIARVFADAITTSSTGTVGPVCSRRRPSAEAFCADHGGTPATLDAALHDCDALYIATPHTAHRDAATAALQAGVAVLCEKPMTCTEADTRIVVEAARASGAPLIEAWMYRCHPQITLARDMLRAGAIGEVEHIEATFTFESDVGPEHRLRNPALGGGAILDIGGYPMSIAMLLSAGTRRFARVHALTAEGKTDATGVDASSHAQAMFESGIKADLKVSISDPPRMSVLVRGTDGSLAMPSPFLPESKRMGLQGSVVISRQGEQETHEPVATTDCFSLEARAIAQMIDEGVIQPRAPMVDHEESIAIASALDLWRTRTGVQIA